MSIVCGTDQLDAEARRLADCSVPVLVVRDAERLLAWLRTERALRAMIDGLRPELETFLVRDLKAWAGDTSGEGSLRFSVRPGLGRVDTHLDVVGAQQRAGVARLWHVSPGSCWALWLRKCSGRLSRWWSWSRLVLLRVHDFCPNMVRRSLNHRDAPAAAGT